MSAVVLRWSASAPVPSRQPSANMPQVASSITSIGVRPVRVISRIDCCGKIGAIAAKPPTARTARTWPGVARPRRSPRPAEVRVPSGRGRSHSRCRRSAAAFFGEAGPTRTVPPGGARRLALEVVEDPGRRRGAATPAEAGRLVGRAPTRRRRPRHARPPRGPGSVQPVDRSRGRLPAGASADVARRRPSLGGVRPRRQEVVRPAALPVPLGGLESQTEIASAGSSASRTGRFDRLTFGEQRLPERDLTTPRAGQYNSACRRIRGDWYDHRSRRWRRPWRHLASWRRHDPARPRAAHVDVQARARPSGAWTCSWTGKPFTSYVWPERLAKPVLYPIRTARGTIVTRGFPLDPRPGERVDHPHQVGLLVQLRRRERRRLLGQLRGDPARRAREDGRHPPARGRGGARRRGARRARGPRWTG